MHATMSSGRVAEVLGHTVRHWEERRQAAAQGIVVTSFTVALSREAGTNGTVVAREVGKRLGWPVYDHELLERIASDVGVQTSLLESVDEQRGSWLRETFESVMGVPFVAESVYVHRLVKAVLALGAYGECVIVGRGAGFILPFSRTFRVRLVAPREQRVATLARIMGLDEAAARARLAAQDKDRTAFVRDHFQHDPEAPQNYDLVLNAARFSPVECAELVLEGVRRWQTQDQKR